MAQQKDDGGLERARKAKDETVRLTGKMSCLRGVGITKVRGKYAVKVSLSEPAGDSLPKDVDGVPIVVEIVGEVRKQAPRTAKG